MVKAVKEKLEQEIEKQIDEGKSTFIVDLSPGMGLMAADVLIRKQRELARINQNISIVGVRPFRSQPNKWPKGWQEEYKLIVRLLEKNPNFVKTLYKDPKTKQEAGELYSKGSSWIVSKAKTEIDINLNEIKELLELEANDRLDSQECNP